MLTLLSPAALWAAAALALPVAVHLWRQPPRTVRLGSLRFLQTHAGRRLHDLRWREFLLLGIRLALLALLACLLARPVWRRPPTRGPQRWILLDPLAAPSGPSLARLRTLQASGYATHRLAPGFSASQSAGDDPAFPAPDIWSLLLEADAVLPAGSILAVFSPARLTSLRGVRPALRSKTEWVQTPDVAGNTLHVWVETARPALTAAETPLPLLGIGDASSIRFINAPPDGWKLEARADAVRLQPPSGPDTPWTKFRAASPLGVLILHDADRAEDARYLAAAIRAAAETDGTPLDLHSNEITPRMSTLPATDWTFWLSATLPPESIQTRHTQLLQDAPRAVEFPPGWIVPQPGTPGAAALTPPVRLWQRGAAPGGTTVWTDGHGAPLLAWVRTEDGLRWRFASRFHPAWTDLPRNTAFPAWIYSLLLPKADPTSKPDFRLAAAAQAQPSENTVTLPLPPLASPEAAAQDLHKLCWTLAAILFGLERAFSHRRSTAKPAAPARPPQTVPAR